MIGALTVGTPPLPTWQSKEELKCLIYDEFNIYQLKIDCNKKNLIKCIEQMLTKNYIALFVNKIFDKL